MHKGKLVTSRPNRLHQQGLGSIGQRFQLGHGFGQAGRKHVAEHVTLCVERTYGARHVVQLPCRVVVRRHCKDSRQAYRMCGAVREGLIERGGGACCGRDALGALQTDNVLPELARGAVVPEQGPQAAMKRCLVLSA